MIHCAQSVGLLHFSLSDSVGNSLQYLPREGQDDYPKYRFLGYETKNYNEP